MTLDAATIETTAQALFQAGKDRQSNSNDYLGQSRHEYG